MYSFYLFEGSFYQGGGGWACFDIRHDLPAITRAAMRYIRQGHWLGSWGDTCVIRVYQRGDVDLELRVYPFARVKIPGFSEISFDHEGLTIGGVPEPGSGYEDVAEIDLEGAVLPDLINEHPDEIQVTIDWGDVTWPDLEPPLLPEDASVLVDLAEGTADAFGHDLPDDEHDALSDRLIEELTDDQHILRFGHNRVL
ncbi:unnamed protein product [[Actinomadura] parvosata subsp. kistnae]|uniref:hypothetical protein n=1 Tax=[Actinomadura] parvosata TaxID=1955412 RepID=UPI000D261C5B|nr:unnamed protein product [Actinomadura parvosata subsp. kistnae]